MAASTVSLAGTRPASRARSRAVPWHIYAVLFASACVIVGVMWDISWHRTIGRDSFWTPAHMAIYLGGVVAGLACGWVVLRTTFAGTSTDRAHSVRFWHYFQAPLGAWVAIWGTFAMLTSAPFDNWWHNAYGLDVKILSPPHAVLALGIAAIQLGALLMTVAAQNREEQISATRHDVLYVVAAALLFLNVTILATQYTQRVAMHHALFYQVSCGVFLLCLMAFARGSRMRWPATTIAGIYTAMVLAMMWILPLFPAVPRLGPIYQPVTHMVPPDFPLLVILPAIALDLILRKWGEHDGGRDRWLLALALGVAFFAVFLVVQWTFAEFLNSSASENWLFATNSYSYNQPSDSYSVRHLFLPGVASVRGLAIALLLAVLSSRIGLACGGWLRRVQR